VKSFPQTSRQIRSTSFTSFSSSGASGRGRGSRTGPDEEHVRAPSILIGMQIVVTVSPGTVTEWNASFSISERIFAARETR